MKTMHLQVAGLVAAVALGVTGMMAVFAQAPHAPVKQAEMVAGPQHIVINLKHYTDDLHAAFMALKIGAGLQKQGAQVTIFVNLEGVRLVDKGTPGDLKWGVSEATPAALLAEFMSAGGTVLVCPHCAQAAGMGLDQIRDGAVLADHHGVIEIFMQADKVIDY
jgi:predicted peroxiredoxin